MTDFFDNNRCFVCGKDNPLGLQLKFTPRNQPARLEAEIIFPESLQGWAGIVHGGLIATVLDEIMVKAAEQNQLKCATAEIQVKFKKPARTGRKYIAIGKIDEVKNRLILSTSMMMTEDNEVVASAAGKLFRLE